MGVSFPPINLFQYDPIGKKVCVGVRSCGNSTASLGFFVTGGNKAREDITAGIDFIVEKHARNVRRNAFRTHKS